MVSNLCIIRNKKRSQSAFTLVEMMIVVTIIGVLAAIVYPNYQNYVIKTKRADAMLEMQNIANRIQSEKLAKGSYTDVALSSFMGSDYNSSNQNKSFPNATNATYTITIWNISGSSRSRITTTNLPNGEWEIQANPISGTIVSEEGSNGRITLDYKGKKCRIINNVTNCGMGDEWRQ